RRRRPATTGPPRPADKTARAGEGARLAPLDACEADLSRIFAGATPAQPVLRRLEPTVRELDLPRGPFDRLIEANRRDQEVPGYATFDELVAYCNLSANPVGELVLHVFHAATPDRIALSDSVCTALQLAEHRRDVAGARAAGRISLPAEALDRFGVSPAELDEAHAGPRLRELMAFEVARARRLLDDGAPLVGRLGGRARIAVAGYV